MRYSSYYHAYSFILFLHESSTIIRKSEGKVSPRSRLGNNAELAVYTSVLELLL